MAITKHHEECGVNAVAQPLAEKRHAEGNQAKSGLLVEGCLHARIFGEGDMAGQTAIRVNGVQHTPYRKCPNRGRRRSKRSAYPDLRSNEPKRLR